MIKSRCHYFSTAPFPNTWLDLVQFSSCLSIPAIELILLSVVNTADNSRQIDIQALSTPPQLCCQMLFWQLNYLHDTLFFILLTVFYDI